MVSLSNPYVNFAGKTALSVAPCYLIGSTFPDELSIKSTAASTLVYSAAEGITLLAIDKIAVTQINPEKRIEKRKIAKVVGLVAQIIFIKWVAQRLFDNVPKKYDFMACNFSLLMSWMNTKQISRHKASFY